MTLTPIIPTIDNESLSSYLARVSRFHADLHLLEFLWFIEFPRGLLMSPNDESLSRLSSFLGIAVEELKQMTFMSRGSRIREFCGETFHAEFAYLNKTSFCPACLLEDGQVDSPSFGCRVGRIKWQIESVRTCERHGIALVRRKNAMLSEKLQIMSDVAPCDSDLVALVKNSSQQQVSDLQKYVVNRFAGGEGPSWLDGQPIDLAARACEMLGIIHTSGTHVNLKLITDSEWNAAGHVGFGYASRGADGIKDALALALDQFYSKNLKGGPQAALGRFYQWLQFNKNSKPHGPVRDVAREFILDHFPIAEGTILFGETVKRQRVHSVFSLARLTGDHPKTIHRSLVSSGLLVCDANRVSASIVFDAEAGEKIMERLRNAITVVKLPAYLNCGRVQAEQLVKENFIPRMTRDADRYLGVVSQVCKRDADSFLDKFMGAATVVDVASDNVMDCIQASHISRWPVIDIVDCVLKGLLSEVQIVDRGLKFKSVLVDPDEVREVLFREKSNGFSDLSKAERISGINRYKILKLTKLRDSEGDTYLTNHFFVNSKGCRVQVFDLAELNAFKLEYVSLQEISEIYKSSPKLVKEKLDCRDLRPIAERHELGGYWYRRADVPSL